MSYVKDRANAIADLNILVKQKVIGEGKSLNLPRAYLALTEKYSVSVLSLRKHIDLYLRAHPDKLSLDGDWLYRKNPKIEGKKEDQNKEIELKEETGVS